MSLLHDTLLELIRKLTHTPHYSGSDVSEVKSDIKHHIMKCEREFKDVLELQGELKAYLRHLKDAEQISEEDKAGMISHLSTALRLAQDIYNKAKQVGRESKMLK